MRPPVLEQIQGRVPPENNQIRFDRWDTSSFKCYIKTTMTTLNKSIKIPLCLFHLINVYFPVCMRVVRHDWNENQGAKIQ